MPLICKRRNCGGGGTHCGFGVVASKQTVAVVLVIGPVVVVLILVRLATYGSFGCGACSAGKLW